MTELKHTFLNKGSILSNQTCKIAFMSYGERLGHAIKLSGVSRADVARAAGRTVQAIGQCIRGETAALTAENSAKVAAYLDVDHYWLATGEGRARPDRAWPFPSFLPSDYRALPESIRLEVEQRLLGAVMMGKPPDADQAPVPARAESPPKDGFSAYIARNQKPRYSPIPAVKPIRKREA